MDLRERLRVFGRKYMGKRLKYIDIVKFLGIFLLFIEHTGNWTELGGKYNY